MELTILIIIIADIQFVGLLGVIIGSRPLYLLSCLIVKCRDSSNSKENRGDRGGLTHGGLIF